MPSAGVVEGKGRESQHTATLALEETEINTLEEQHRVRGARF
jgi:hypothetical protein